MVELYEAKGVSSEDATLILNTMAKYHDVFLDHMMNVELGLQVRRHGCCACCACARVPAWILFDVTHYAAIPTTPKPHLERLHYCLS